MKILQVHNAYQHMGGEEVVVAAEHAMLQHYGHDPHQWIVENSGIEHLDLVKKAGIALRSVWSQVSYRQAQQKLAELRPDVVHVHNTVPMISPSIYAACHDAGVPVVHTLHNYKLICPGAYLYRQGSVCEDCIGKTVPLPAVQHGCYRGSHLQAAIAVTGLAAHRLRGTFRHDVGLYIALTQFARQKFIEGGLPAERVAVKPNFVTAAIQPGQHQGGYALFVGKLVQYKGIETLLRSWHLLEQSIPLKVVGQGPLEVLLRSNLPRGVEYLGALPREQVLSLMQDASLVVFPSEWYEGFPMTIAEAFASACPVLAGRLAATGEIVREGVSGWLFNPGDAHDLARVVEQAWSDQAELQRRGHLARRQYDDCYSLEKNYQMTMSLYETVIRWQKDGRLLSVF
jgi:glycosyltransferase involved in cell wall biosynthesis